MDLLEHSIAYIEEILKSKDNLVESLAEQNRKLTETNNKQMHEIEALRDQIRKHSSKTEHVQGLLLEEIKCRQKVSTLIDKVHEVIKQVRRLNIDSRFVDDINQALSAFNEYEDRVQVALRKQFGQFQTQQDKMNHFKQLLSFTDLHVPKKMEALNKQQMIALQNGTLNQ